MHCKDNVLHAHGGAIYHYEILWSWPIVQSIDSLQRIEKTKKKKHIDYDKSPKLSIKIQTWPSNVQWFISLSSHFEKTSFICACLVIKFHATFLKIIMFETFVITILISDHILQFIFTISVFKKIFGF